MKAPAYETAARGGQERVERRERQADYVPAVADYAFDEDGAETLQAVPTGFV